MSNQYPEVNRVGEENINTYGSKMKIIEYIRSKNMTVQFEDGFIIKTDYGGFKTGYVKNPYDKSIKGIGYRGEGIYTIKSLSYAHWGNMFERCYSEKYHVRNSSYIGCTVCNEWHNFQTFSDWFYKEYYTSDNEQMHLDKDILFKGNRIYSPETCVIAPRTINTLFVKHKSTRGKYPIGVYFHKRERNFLARCGDGNGGTICLGSYNNPIYAFRIYKKYKEGLIKRVAEEYKSKIPEKLYLAMQKYQVEITD